ncbi:hypothetical protein JTE90_008288 [Oedothorax gibbosus]|uniref:Serine aminopeptidase S33 domain-containing protein n=1 Tax=Oedothorax gibbosus TaxID=931172 RepID=A0AAV6UI98_9ARAC|nr:hypothetical protein JTE90_008288 [Oedothorax gibbosus]
MEDRKMSCFSLFSLFCCPPCPRHITEKIVFLPPRPPTYEIGFAESRAVRYVFSLSPDVDTSSLKKIVHQEANFCTTSRGNKVALLYMKTTDRNKRTIIFSHGNAVDVGLIHRFCVDLGLSTGCDIVVYDYSGYGQSDGKPSENNLYADIKSVWDYTLTFLEPDPFNIILYGHSVGSVGTVDLASKVECGGVILHSAFTSAYRVVCPGEKKHLCCDTLKK